MNVITQDILDKIVAYETGGIFGEQVLDFFQDLVNAGVVEQLPWYYRNTARHFLEAGFIEPPREE